jgi:hypothetical protein
VPAHEEPPDAGASHEADASADGEGQLSKNSTIQDIRSFLLQNEGSDAASNMTLRAYTNELRHADRQEKRWRRNYYTVRLTILISSAAITALSGIDFSGAKFVILGLGALTTVVNGTFDLFHMLNRWRIYRVLRYRLITRAVAAPSAPDLLDHTLRVGLLDAIQEFESNYITQIATEGSPPDRPRGVGSDQLSPGHGSKPTVQ